MAKVEVGLDRFWAKKRKALNGARIGLLCHQASVDSQFRHALKLFRTYPQLTTLFAPEHGFWGTAQDQIEIAPHRDPTLNIPIYSLYGQQRAPSAESLSNIDILVCDLQDVGSRYYTFIWTILLAMQACASNGKKCIVLDRPNPLGGVLMEGPLLDHRYASFVGLYSVPVRHGMTVGELARWANDTYQLGVDLEVIPMSGWKRSMLFEETSVPWILPSPNMPTLDTARVYPGQCLMEGTNLSEGRGTTRPFEIFGAPFINPEQLSKLLNDSALPGVSFRSCFFEPTFHKFQGQLCGGIQLHVTNKATFRPFLTTVSILKRIYDLYSSLFTWRKPPYEYEHELWPIDILCGGPEVRLNVESGTSLRELEGQWKADCAAFAHQRKPFLLYN